jgi:hypothetical protein
MAYDILLGKTRRNWARGAQTTVIPPEIPQEGVATIQLTEAEMDKLADIAATKIAADMGNKAALRKMVVVRKNVAKLQRVARKGDPAARAKAKRALAVLEQSGVFRDYQSFSLTDLSGDALETSLVPNTAYRAAILSRAVKLAGGRKPTTKDFHGAKKSVDKDMSAAGLSLYLPGARPGRITLPS